MSDDDDDFELGELNWDDALDEWEGDLDAKAEAQSEPMPQRSDEARPLYQPPAPDERFSHPLQSATPASFDDFDDDDDDEMESTRIAEIPQELIRSLVKSNDDAHQRPTRPPPADHSTAGEDGDSVSVDLDLDGLLSGLDDEIEPAPSLDTPSASGVMPSPADDDDTLDPFTDVEDDDLVSSFEPPTRSREEDAAVLGLDAGELEDLERSKGAADDVLGLDEAPAEQDAEEPADEEPADDPEATAAAPGALPKPGSLRDRLKRPKGGPPAIPKPGGIPKPGRPGIPRPPGIPKPGAGLPSIPRPGAKLPPAGRGLPPNKRRPLPPLPRPPKPGGLPGIPKPGVPKPGAADGDEPSVTDSSPELDADLDDFLESIPPGAGSEAPAPEPTPPADDEDTAAAEEPSGPPVDEPATERVSEPPPLPPRGEAISEPPPTEAVVIAADDADSTEEAVFVDEDDDEEPEAVVTVSEPAAEQEGELVFEAGDDEEWDEDELAAIEAAEAELEAAEAKLEAEAPDRGAEAARRSFRSRKPRDEHFPMVGGDSEALTLRRRLLESMAGQREGALAARLFVAAAELAEQLGEADDARRLYRAALEADREDVVALRALRRDAVLRQDWDRLAELFMAEATLDLSTWERATALTGLAELKLSRFDDPAGAEKAASKALEVQPASIVARLLIAEARWRQGEGDALEHFASARDLWDDPDARAALAIEEARTAESKGDREGARALFTWANEVDPEALDGWFGRARTSSRKDADPKGAIEALEYIAAYCEGTPLREAILSRASRVATRLYGDPMLGVRLLEGATSVGALQTRADAALQTDDAALGARSVESWASAAGGTERALALVRLAELVAARGDLDAAESALRDAALADGSLGTIRVVREVIARRSGDSSRLVEAAEGGGALASAARVVLDPEALGRERELLDHAVDEGTALVAADVLYLDVVASQGDQAAIDVALRRQADRVPPEQRIGSLLAMTERAIDRDELDAAETLLAEARQIVPGDPVVLRPLGRLMLRRDAQEAAALWLEEASVSAGGRSAYAATQAGRILAAAGGDAVGALRRALDAEVGYRPAAWALRPLALDLDDTLTLGELYEQLADTAASPASEAASAVRGALLRAGADPKAAAELLERARELVPRDAVLQSLLLRLSGTTSPAERAKMLVAAAEHAPPDLARVFTLQAAAAFEEAEDATAAAAAYRTVGQTDPDDPVVRVSLDRAEIEADEVARVASRYFDAVKSAEDDEAKTAALEALAKLDLSYRDDAASAVLSLQSILEIAPGHLPSLRTLQRYFAEQKRTEDAARVVEALAANVEEGGDVTAHVRLARRLMLVDPEAPGDVADEMLLANGERAHLDLWLSSRVLGAARAKNDGARARMAANALANQLGAAEERAALRLRTADLEEDEDARLALLEEAARAAPSHPLAAERLALACEEAGRKEDAAEAYELAGAAAEVPEHAARHFAAAGAIWSELEQTERAVDALKRASERDVTHGDVFDRLHELLTATDDKAGLADLYAARLAAGGETEDVFALYVKQADLRTEISDLPGAKAALRSALALSPERVEALRKLANVCLDDEDWRGAAEILIRIARVRKEREELRWVFFTLGDIYDQHMPDARRAEAAYQRVLKLFPRDLPAMERLAGLYERESEAAKAAEVLEQLAEADVDPEKNRAHRLKLAALHEAAGDLRKTESTLEEARKTAPTDLIVVRTLADFYQRQSATNALAMHLRRAVNDFRHALESDLGDASAWPGLVEVLRWGDAMDAASAAASAAQALGVVDVEMSKLVDAHGSAPGAGQHAVAADLDDSLAPPALNAPTRMVFQLCGDALEKSLPLDLSAYRAEKLDRRDNTIRPLITEAARWFGIGAVELYVTPAAPRVCVPVYSNPCTILLGSELLAITDEREKLFVATRALKIAKANLSVVVRAQPQEVVALLAGLVMSYDPHHTLPGVNPQHAEEAARRIVKNIRRNVRDDLGPLVMEMAGRPGYDPSQLAMSASQWGNRVGLLATGSAPAAVGALAKLSGERDLPADPAGRVALVQRFAEAANLLRFAISDVHFDVRRRLVGGARG